MYMYIVLSTLLTCTSEYAISGHPQAIRPFYTSEVIQFWSGFNPDWTRFVPSTMHLNRFQSNWFWAGLSQSTSRCGFGPDQTGLSINHWWWIHVTQLRVTCVGNGWSARGRAKKRVHYLQSVAKTGCNMLLSMDASEITSMCIPSVVLFSVFCFILLFLPLELFACSPFSTFRRNNTVTSRTAPEVLRNPLFPHKH